MSQSRHLWVSDKAGVSATFELALRFTDWAQEIGAEKVTAESIKAHWGVSRATSYRWLNAFRAARGLPA